MEQAPRKQQRYRDAEVAGTLCCFSLLLALPGRVKVGMATITGSRKGAKVTEFDRSRSLSVAK